MHDLTQSGPILLGFEDEWTEEDMHDLTVYSMRQFAKRYPYEEGLIPESVGDEGGLQPYSSHGE